MEKKVFLNQEGKQHKIMMILKKMKKKKLRLKVEEKEEIMEKKVYLN